MIKPQFLNILNSSFLLWLNNYILKRGQCFTQNSARFYPSNSQFNGYYSYQLPYKQLVADSSVTTPMTGVYINNTFITPGISGLTGLDYDNGKAYFTSNVNNYVISGNFPLKDINVNYLNFSEQKLLFETKFNLKSKYTQTLSGLNNDETTYPCVYVKSEVSQNKPFALGGMDDTITNFGVYMFCESQYQLDALKSILNDSNKEYIPLFNTGEMPYNVFGGFKNNNIFNYDNATLNKVRNGSGALISDVSVTIFQRHLYGEFSKLNPEVYWAIADFTVSMPRFPRSWS